MVGQPRIDGFAEVTGDHQWIHVDVERARDEAPFGGPVAHGFLTLSLLAAAISEAGVVPADAKGVINYGLDKVRFLAPVPAGAEVACGFRSPGSRTRAPAGSCSASRRRYGSRARTSRRSWARCSPWSSDKE